MERLVLRNIVQCQLGPLFILVALMRRPRRQFKLLLFQLQLLLFSWSGPRLILVVLRMVSATFLELGMVGPASHPPPAVSAPLLLLAARGFLSFALIVKSVVIVRLKKKRQ